MTAASATVTRDAIISGGEERDAPTFSHERSLPGYREYK